MVKAADKAVAAHQVTVAQVEGAMDVVDAEVRPKGHLEVRKVVHRAVETTVVQASWL